MAAPTERANPYGVFNFVVKAVGNGDVDFGEIGFMECSGLDGATLAMEYRDDKVPGTGLNTRKLPGLEQYPNVVLRRGLTGNAALWKWRKKVRDASALDHWAAVKAEILVTLQNEARTEVMTWRLIDAWPCRLSGPTLNARTNEIAVEALELCCDRIEIDEG
ncbi:MAG: phage tail protein [Myxococcota bacterium]